MNNSIYNFLYDSIINTYLLKHCGLRPTDGDQYGLVGESAFSQALSIPRRLTMVAPVSALPQ